MAQKQYVLKVFKDGPDKPPVEFLIQARNRGEALTEEARYLHRFADEEGVVPVHSFGPRNQQSALVVA